MWLGKDGIAGLILSLPERTIDRIFHHKPVVATVVLDPLTMLETDDRVFLYASDGLGGLQGEGRIATIAVEKDVGGLSRYGGKLCLSGEEIGNCETKLLQNKGASRLRVLVLSRPTKYTRPLKCGLTIPEQGLCVTREMIAKVALENQA